MLPAAVDMVGPYRRTNTSLLNRMSRATWSLVHLVLFRPTPRPFHRWRVFLLRLFGARLGRDCHIYAGASIWAPWNLVCGDGVAIADGAEIYNPALISIGHHAVISQQAFLCGASHDYYSIAFPMISAPINVGAYAWIGARATIQMGVSVGEGAVLALGSIATRGMEPWNVYAGSPARRIKARPRLYPSAGGAAGVGS
jgi:putative colanic acid biosynthesis acetyltransferase WcaF